MLLLGSNHFVTSTKFEEAFTICYLGGREFTINYAFKNECRLDVVGHQLLSLRKLRI